MAQSGDDEFRLPDGWKSWPPARKRQLWDQLRAMKESRDGLRLLAVLEDLDEAEREAGPHPAAVAAICRARDRLLGLL